MSDKTDKLSSLMDGELHDIDSWLSRLGKDEDMLEAWKRYHLARDTMKGQLSEHATLDISSAVSQAIEDEPVIFTPLWKRLSPRHVAKQAAGLAVAAAVGTVAVLSVQQTQIASEDVTTVANANATQVTLQPNQIRQVTFTTREKLDAAIESKLSSYLVNHNEFSQSIRTSGVMPYSRIVSFDPSANENTSSND